MELLAFIGLAEFADMLASELSVGRRRLLALGRAMAMRPRLLLLDERSGGGTGQSKSSACTDILNRRRTEVDWINGAVVRLGEKHGVATPVNSTLVGAVKGLETHFG